ncbi:MAG: leucine-rich repeat domain-containing protein [Reichenbachiella sp.]
MKIYDFIFFLTLLSNQAFAQSDTTYFSMQDALTKPDQVFRLNLQNQELKQLSTEISKFKNLEQLHLPNTIDAIPSSIGELSNLKYLNIDEYFEAVDDWDEGFKESKEKVLKYRTLPATIGQLSNLERLNVPHFDLKEIPESIGNLKKLVWLDLKDNAIEELPASLAKLTQLKKLYLSGNKIIDIPEFIGQLENLEKLDLSSMDKDGIRLSKLSTSICSLQKLEELDLARNNFNESDQIAIQSCMPENCEVTFELASGLEGW